MCRGSDVFLYGLYGWVTVAQSLRLAFDVRIFHCVDTGLVPRTSYAAIRSINCARRRRIPSSENLQNILS